MSSARRATARHGAPSADAALLDLFAEPAAAPLPLRAADDTTFDRRGSWRTAGAPPAVEATLEALHALGVLRDVDVHLARAAARLAGEADPLVVLGAAAASRAPGAGHVCVELDAPDRLVRLEHAAAVRWPAPDVWTAALARSPLVCTPAEWAGCCDAGEARPLVLDGARLYLARYWGYQRRLCEALGRRAARLRADVDAEALRAGLARLFPRDDGHAEGAAGAPLDLQRAAAAATVLRGLAVVTGGPGTGKTTTVLRVLALLADQARALGDPLPRVALAAPTGKAAARLTASIAAGLAALDLPGDVAAAIGGPAVTVHRLLRWDPRRPTRFRHDAESPLDVDVVVVDEGSMVDLALMAKLVDAVPDAARLVLLGDRDQLASVEAGSILADVCGEAANRFSPAFAHRLGAACGAPAAMHAHAAPGPLPPIADCVVRLTRSRRFDAGGGIGALARAINDGDADAALAVLADDPSGAVRLVAVDGARAPVAALRRHALPEYGRAVRTEGPAAALDALDRLRVLAAHRAGPFGVAGLNACVVEELARDGALPRDAVGAPWFHGQPVLVTANDATLELANGDVGVVLRDGAGGTLRAWFRDGAGVRPVAPSRLPAHEPVFAMTVHKSQGSEFDEVVLVLPPRPSPVLTRELLYTGVTRARRRVTVVGTAESVRGAIAERVQRASGLREALWRH